MYLLASGSCNLRLVVALSFSDIFSSFSVVESCSVVCILFAFSGVLVWTHV